MSEEPGALADGGADMQADDGATGSGAKQRKGVAESRPLGCLALVVVTLWVAGFASWYGAVAGRPMARLQWAGSVTAAGRLAKTILPRYWPALAASTAPVLGLATGLVFACMLGLLVFWSGRGGWLARLGIAASIATLLLGLLEFGALAWALHDRLRSGWLLAAGEGLSLGTASVLLLAAAIGLGALCASIRRIMPHRRPAWWEDTALRAAAGTDARPLVISPPPTDVPLARGMPGPGAFIASQSGAGGGEWDDTWWSRWSSGSHSHWQQGYAYPGTWATGPAGVCISGGGVRSASVALGALQALREAGKFASGPGGAAHLVSVSGGGYTAGAMQLALQDGSTAVPGDVFAAGSAEEDHLRRHISYLSSTLRQWLVALGVLLRGVACSLVVIGLTVTLLGLAVGWLYRWMPIVSPGTAQGLAELQPWFLRHGPPGSPPGFPAIQPGVAWALATAAVLAAGVVVRGLMALPARAGQRRRSLLRRAERGGMGITRAALLVVGLVGLVLPTLLWLSAWLTWHPHLSRAEVATAGSVSGVVMFAGAAAATLWRSRKTIVSYVSAIDSGKSTVSQALPTSVVQMIIMWICLLVVVLAALLTACWVATSPLVGSWWAVAPVAILLAIATFIDQTAFSLHQVYRQRLVGAFAVRRDTYGPHRNRRASSVARPYGRHELTLLSKFGAAVQGFPQLAFCTTANIVAEDRTPPGRPAVPFTLAHDYIGGPETGWVRTDFLEQIVSPRLRADLTVDSAMAISGAAFASAMGSQTRFYEVFLALTNARLGAWLPNPAFVGLKLANRDNWTIPGLPRIRRLPYLAREIFGIHPASSRLLLCTDGGHYENLGLVELLRRRCELIYCIDASGSPPPFDDSLAAAMTLAREELGVEITLHDALGLVPGSGAPVAPAGAFTSLNQRLSRTCVVTGTITYPELTMPGGTRKTGILIFAQAVLTPDMPYDVLSFTQDDVSFPRDSTGDQWFNSAQFDAYQRLGYFIGQAAAAAAGNLKATDKSDISVHPILARFLGLTGDRAPT
jgi:hypothetical protein